MAANLQQSSEPSLAILHSRSNICASLCVILGLFAARMGYPLADPVITLFIYGLILHTVFEIVKDCSKALLDRAPVEWTAIIDIAKSVMGVCTCHAVRTQGMAGDIFVDMHIGFDAALSMDAALQVREEVERAKKSPGRERRGYASGDKEPLRATERCKVSLID